MYFPKLTAPAQRRVTVDRFLGLDRRAGSAMGCFQNMENLWSGGYPALETRPARGETAVLSKPNGLTCRDALVWVDGTALYVGGEKTGLALSDGEKQLVNMGAYLLIWPDRKYINTQDLSDFGSMENRNVTAGEVTTALCRSGGEELGDYAAGEAAPDAPEAGTLWLDTSDAEPVMKRYDGSAWLDVENVCTKISAAGIGRGFAAGDGVTVEGCEAQTLNGLHVLDAAGDDWIAVPAATAKVGSQTAEVTAARRVPDMDFVVEQGNRLWGCKYGIVDGRPVNEIYASKLDPGIGMTLKANTLNVLTVSSKDIGAVGFGVPDDGRIDLRAVKLELGGVSTLAHQEPDGSWAVNEIPDWAEMLWKCQRYLQLYTTAAARPGKAADCRPVMSGEPVQSTLSIDGVTYYANSMGI